jgi:hypothetical protein
MADHPSVRPELMNAKMLLSISKPSVGMRNYFVRLVNLPNASDPITISPTWGNLCFFLANPSARPERPVVVVRVYATLVRPILQYGAACCDPYREGQIHALDKVQKEAAKFTPYTNESI